MSPLLAQSGLTEPSSRCPLSRIKRTSLPHDAASAFDLPDGRSFEGRNRMDDLLACQSVSAYPERKNASAKQCVTRDGDDPTLLLLIAVLVVVAVVARRFNTAPSILLVIAGIALALIPGLPRMELAPELVLLGILPPLIYSAGVAMSWREFRFNLRPITLLAVGCVVFTSCAVAAVAHWLLGMPLAVGFVLGAIVSPPDVVAPLSIVRRLGVPRRLVVVLEGEGLANDATALILYRFAVAAVGSGVFSLTQAAGEFA